MITGNYTKKSLRKSSEEISSAARAKLHKLFSNIQSKCPHVARVQVDPKTVKFKCGTLNTPCNVAHCPRIKKSNKK